jgi:hypothetical protein
MQADQTIPLNALADGAGHTWVPTPATLSPSPGGDAVELSATQIGICGKRREYTIDHALRDPAARVTF